MVPDSYYAACHKPDGLQPWSWVIVDGKGAMTPWGGYCEEQARDLVAALNAARQARLERERANSR